VFSRFAKMNAIASLVVAVAAFVPVVSQADDAPQIKVSYAKVDLSSPQGAALLYKQLAHAAKEVCPDPAFESRSFLIEQDMRKCRTRAIEGAVRSINSPQLTAIFEQQTEQKASVVRVSQAR
jgi:UrcA family protein